MIYVKKLVNAQRVYEIGYSGKGVNVAVLDSGIYEHKELKNRIVKSFDYVNRKNVIYDDCGHGTHVAGIIGGSSIGIAPSVNLLSFKVLDQNGNGDAIDSISALEYIYKNSEALDIRIVNISFGFLEGADLFEQNRLMDYVERIWKKGIAVVVAAGNKGPYENTITVPGVNPLVITVGAKDSFSGNGPTNNCIMKPEILAPGRHIFSLMNQEGKYCYKSGTSMSAPIVTGAIALALEKKPSLSPKAIKIALYRSCTPLSKEKQKSWGMLNVDKFLEIV